MVMNGKLPLGHIIDHLNSLMSFGLTNAPMAFQQFMNDIFSDLLDVCVMIYLDDILIYSNNMFEHHWHVKEVLKHLRKAGLYAKAEKCEFHSESVVSRSLMMDLILIIQFLFFFYF